MKKIRRNFVFTYCIIFLVAIALLLPVCFAAFAIFLPPVYDETFPGELKYKVERLENTEGKRIIIIGGSSVAFGINSALIEQYTQGYSVVNFGMYASLGTKVMLDIAEKNIRRGDIIILSPEQNEQTLSLYFGTETFWQCADGALSLYGYLKSSEKERALGGFAQFAVDKFRYNSEGTILQPSDIYRRDSFNEYGDIKPGLRANNIMFGGWDANTPVSLSPTVFSEEFTDYVNSFNEKVTSSGATLYYRFCPMNKSAVIGDIEDCYNALDSVLDCRIIGNPEESIMDREWFYDTNFHLNDSGVILNTRNIIRDIKTQLFDSTPTDIEIPEKPSLGNVQGSGDNSDSGLFTYESRENGVIITGLTEAGLTAEEIIVPYSVEQGIVAGFEANVFAGNTVIKRITLQDNIRFIYDRSFDGCTALERITIKTRVPNTISVGNALLEGTDATIYVPREAYATFVTNYTWAQYHSRIAASD